MIGFLCKIFVKDAENVNDPSVRRRYGSLAGAVGIVLNFLLCIGKLIAGTIASSVSITADALNNLSDAGSQVITLISFKLSAKPADRDHPFGHARIEYVASMIVSFLVLLIGVELFKSSVDKILHPEDTVFDLISVIILAASILVKLWLFLFNRVIAKKIDSTVMRATAADSLSDAAATAAVLVSMLVLKFFDVDIDAYIGIAVSVVIIIAGLKILNETKNVILGEAPSEEIIKDIRTLVGEYDGALGIHDLVVHNYGAGRTIVSLHIEVDGSVDIFKTHDMVDNIEKRLGQELGILCTIHMDPIVTDDAETTALRDTVTLLMREIDPAWKIHDFRFVKGETHKNLIFDLVVPFECKLTSEEIRRIVSKKIKEIDGNCFAVITIDKE